MTDININLLYSGSWFSIFVKMLAVSPRVFIISPKSIIFALLKIAII